MWLLPNIRIRVRKRRRVVRVGKRSRAHYELHKERARVCVTERLTYWSQVYGVTYGRVAIRNQRSRWGSCSTKGNLNFNYKLVFLPQELIDYVVVHELCHLIEFNHSPAFWGHVARTLPDYVVRKNLLHEVSKTGAMQRLESAEVSV